MLICSIAWSSGFLFMKLAGSASPWVLAASRATIATVALSLWFLARGRSPVMRRRELAPWLVLGTLNGWMPNVLTAYALTQIPAGLSSMIQASGPLMVAVMSHFAFADERLTTRRAGGVLLGFVGMTVLIGPSALQGTNGGLLGVLRWRRSRSATRSATSMPASSMASRPSASRWDSRPFPLPAG